MEDTKGLSTQLVPNPQLWRLLLEVDPQALHVMAFSIAQDNSAICRSIDYPSDAASGIAGLEEVIYDNPLLLADFRSVDVLISTPRYMVIPAELQPMSAEIAREMWGEDSDFYLLENPVAETDALIITAVDTSLWGFLTRTFPEARIANRMAPLCRYFSINNRIGNSDKLYVNLCPQTVAVAAFDSNRLLIANTYPIKTAMDAVFYVLKAAEAVNLNPTADRIFISGNADMRDTVIEELRRYVGYVMPLIFPAEIFRHGKATLNIPFELAILPLCE